MGVGCVTSRRRMPRRQLPPNGGPAAPDGIRLYPQPPSGQAARGSHAPCYARHAHLLAVEDQKEPQRRQQPRRGSRAPDKQNRHQSRLVSLPELRESITGLKRHRARLQLLLLEALSSGGGASCPPRAIIKSQHALCGQLTHCDAAARSRGHGVAIQSAHRPTDNKHRSHAADSTEPGRLAIWKHPNNDGPHAAASKPPPHARRSGAVRPQARQHHALHLPPRARQPKTPRPLPHQAHLHAVDDP